MYNTLLDEYYKMRGWDRNGTVPDELKEKLGIPGLVA
jgi:aldehyde:ferredoxin oxidoreductase